MKKILAVTACPTGIAHTYMAAEALQKAAKEKEAEIKVETRGAVGVENGLTEQEISEAHAIIIAADTDADEGRFAGKPVVKVSVGEAIKNPGKLIEEALAKTSSIIDNISEVKQVKQERLSQRSGPYKHLMTGVSYMLPLVVAGGLIIALSFIFGIKAFEHKGTLAAALMDIGGGSAFALIVPTLAGFISFSIAEKSGLAPGLVGGMLATKLGAGFLGGIIAGFLAGYTAKWLKDYIKLPQNFEGLKPVLIIPLLSTLIVGLIMTYIVGAPVKMIMDALTGWLKGMSSGNAVILGLLTSNVYGPMAAVMAAGMTPPLGLWLATFMAPKKFSVEEREAGKAAAVLGISFITEGAIPFAAADPFRVIPSIVVGSAITGALSMAFGATLRAPHGGIFVLPIPNAVGNLGMYIVAILAVTLVTALLVSFLKKK